MGEHKDVDHIEEVVVEENRDTCPGPDPTPEWFARMVRQNGSPETLGIICLIHH